MEAAAPPSCSPAILRTGKPWVGPDGFFLLLHGLMGGARGASAADTAVREVRELPDSGWSQKRRWTVVDKWMATRSALAASLTRSAYQGNFIMLLWTLGSAATFSRSQGYRTVTKPISCDSTPERGGKRGQGVVCVFHWSLSARLENLLKGNCNSDLHSKSVLTM